MPTIRHLPVCSPLSVHPSVLVLVLVRVAVGALLLAGCSENGPVSTEAAAPAGPALAGHRLYVEPGSNAARQAKLWRDSRPADAALMEKVAAQPTAAWFGDWNTDVEADVRAYVSRAADAGALPVLVAYNTPVRDCGSHSGGGATDPDVYRAWIRAFARGIGDKPAVVVLEPDALGLLECLESAVAEDRLDLLRDAVQILSATPNAYVYIDAGTYGWQSVADMAVRLQEAGIESADGFALNISNFQTTENSIRYGEAISDALGGDAHFVIDTSRNGLGPTPDHEWCNPPGRALGAPPTLDTAHPRVDALLWIKPPGESDGLCNGGPRAGTWWPEYALGLAKRAAW